MSWAAWKDFKRRQRCGLGKISSAKSGERVRCYKGVPWVIWDASIRGKRVERDEMPTIKSIRVFTPPFSLLRTWHWVGDFRFYIGVFYWLWAALELSCTYWVVIVKTKRASAFVSRNFFSLHICIVAGLAGVC